MGYLDTKLISSYGASGVNPFSTASLQARQNHESGGNALIGENVPPANNGGAYKGFYVNLYKDVNTIAGGGLDFMA